MPDFQAVPIVSDQHALRLEPFAKAPASSPVADATINSISNSTAPTVRSGASPTVDAATADGELDESEIAELQTAAAGGDYEASDLLKQLGLGLAGAAAAGGAVYGGMQLRNALANRGGATSIENSAPGTSLVPSGEPGPYMGGIKTHIYGPNGEIYQPGPDEQLRLPAPQRALPAPTGGPIQQPAPPAQRAIPDLNRVPRETDAAYAQKAEQDAARAREVELRGKLGQAKGMKLREAAQTARKVIR